MKTVSKLWIACLFMQYARVSLFNSRQSWVSAFCKGSGLDFVSFGYFTGEVHPSRLVYWTTNHCPLWRYRLKPSISVCFVFCQTGRRILKSNAVCCSFRLITACHASIHENFKSFDSLDCLPSTEVCLFYLFDCSCIVSQLLLLVKRYFEFFQILFWLDFVLNWTTTSPLPLRAC